MNNLAKKLNWSLPWLARYPARRLQDFWRQPPNAKRHVIIAVANHFEPAWTRELLPMPLDQQLRRLEKWYQKAREIGEAVRDTDGTKFRHTNFYPAEQYHSKLLDICAAMQAENLGDVEVHLHHGVKQPDTSANTRRILTEFRDTLAERHGCLSYASGDPQPKFAFVHGNWALANSAHGKFCGVDDEMQILAEIGCYADLTLPSAPDISQVPMINAIYECGNPLDQAVPHRSGENVRVGKPIEILPLIMTGVIGFDWSRRRGGLPFPRLEDSDLSSQQTLDRARFRRWLDANVQVLSRPEWTFIKLHCHGFIEKDQDSCIGERARRFFSEIIEEGAKTGEYDVHFVCAREMFNIVCAAVEGKSGNPHQYRQYRLQPQKNLPSGSSQENDFAVRTAV